MLKVIKQFFTLLTPNQRKNFYLLQFLVLLMSIMEIIGVASVIPFMTLVGDITQLQKDTLIAKVYQASGITSELRFVFLLGIGVLAMLLISTIVFMFTIWRMYMFANKIGMEIADTLYTYYIKQEWLFHASGSSSRLTKKIATEVQRVTSGILVPLMNMNARIVVAIFISVSIFIFDPKVAIFGLTIFVIAYFTLFKTVKRRLQLNGRTISDVNEERFRLMNEGFGGIKDVLLLGRDENYIKRFNLTGLKLAYSQGTNAALAYVPRYFMELVAFGSMISLVLYLISSHNGNLAMILPVLSVYALATFKLLPAFQHIYASLAYIKGHTASFESIQSDFKDSLNNDLSHSSKEKVYLYPKNKISIENVTFAYPKIYEPSIKKISFTITANNIVGIVGSSGSGKSTLIDILLGFMKPQQGYIKIDDVIINAQNRRHWQNSIGLVSQSIFLSENSIAQNIAFGISDEKIDLDQVQKVLKLSNLYDFVQSLEKGIDTKVGERGVKLSGGQRQRIGIARALYHDPKVLVFDEATSSLDGVTEKMIMDSILSFEGKKTIIIIAHRLKTVQKCDQIFYLDKGELVGQGTYEELIKNNSNFKKIAAHA